MGVQHGDELKELYFRDGDNVTVSLQHSGKTGGRMFERRRCSWEVQKNDGREKR